MHHRFLASPNAAPRGNRTIGLYTSYDKSPLFTTDERGCARVPDLGGAIFTPGFGAERCGRLVGSAPRAPPLETMGRIAPEAFRATHVGIRLRRLHGVTELGVS